MSQAAESSLIPGTFNARDLGGLEVPGGSRLRTGRLLRSDAPVSLGEPGRAALVRLGLGTAVDLREPIERRNAPAELDGLGIELITRPLIGTIVADRGRDLPALYDELLDTRGEAFAAAIDAVAAAGPAPVLFFCSAGKDRTGLISALILSLLGVAEDDIVADYHRTEANMQGEFRQRVQRAAVLSGLSEQEIAVGLGAPEALMRHVLARLAADGGAEAYLRRHGLSAQVPARLAATLLEP